MTGITQQREIRLAKDQKCLDLAKEKHELTFSVCKQISPVSFLSLKATLKINKEMKILRILKRKQKQ